MILLGLHKYMMKNKYTPILKGSKPGLRGRTINPNCWVSGPDPIDHEKYYAWLKHRAQARYRKEPYDLSWEDWQTIWPTDLFLKRGRRANDLCLQRIDTDCAWSLHNCEVISRFEHLSVKRRRDIDGR